jgi:hypothetical protein
MPGSRRIGPARTTQAGSATTAAIDNNNRRVLAVLAYLNRS